MKLQLKSLVLALIVIAGFIFMGGFLLYFKIGRPPVEPAEEVTVNETDKKIELQPSPIKAVFTCKDKKSIEAVFSGNTVSLVLSDGRKLELNQALSASGARYANQDETLVFWNKGNTAFIEENNTTTFQDCVEKNPQ